MKEEKPNVAELNRQARQDRKSKGRSQSSAGKSSSGSKSNKSLTDRSCPTWAVACLGCFATYALFMAKGSDNIKYSKFIGSNMASIGIGVGGCYVISVHVYPSTCFSGEDQEMYQKYRTWYQEQQDSQQADYLKGNSSSTTSHPHLMLDAPSKHKRRKRFILRQTLRRESPEVVKMTEVSTDEPPTSTSTPTPTTPGPSGDVSASAQSTRVDQPTVTDESTSTVTPETSAQEVPHDAPSTKQKIDPEELPTTTPSFKASSWLDPTENLTIKLAILTILLLVMAMLAMANTCALLGLLCHPRNNRAKAPAHPSTYTTMDIERTSNGPTRTTTWEDALNHRGLGGLGRLDTPTPPPPPALQDDLAV